MGQVSGEIARRGFGTPARAAGTVAAGGLGLMIPYLLGALAGPIGGAVALGTIYLGIKGYEALGNGGLKTGQQLSGAARPVLKRLER